MFPRLPIGPRRLLNDCSHSATASFWRSAINLIFFTPVFFTDVLIASTRCPRPTDTKYVNRRLRTCDWGGSRVV